MNTTIGEATAPAPRAPASVIDVLIVDDEPVIRDSLGLALGHAGLRVRTAPGVHEAFALLEAHPVRLVVTDVCMPEISGLDLIVTMSTTWPDTPVLTISGGGALGGAEQMFDVAGPLGSCRMLAKPFSLRTFMDLVSELLSKSPVPQQA